MLQLVNDKVQILNPPKDNLICDAAKVEEILGVPPERVIDVMALRGDTIDNIPGAPGIGDKGSVEIIKRFGTVEQALDRAAEVEKKTYRESLQNNRDIILFSKSMATIDADVPVELDVEAMRAGEPDVEALRQLFTELEFTSLLKELLPVSRGHRVALRGSQIRGRCRERPHVARARRMRLPSPIEQPKSEAASPMKRTKQAEAPLDAAHAAAQPMRRAAGPDKPTRPRRHLGRCRVQPPSLQLDSGTRPQSKLRASPRRRGLCPKSIHDYKSAHPRARRPRTFDLQGVQHDPMLYSYLLDPTYSSHRLPTSLSAASISNLAATSPKPPTSPAGWPPLCAMKSSKPGCSSSTKKSISRWSRFSRAWNRPE